MDYGLYIHIPFCKSKCKYCDFVSYSGREGLMPEYFSCLVKELKGYVDDFSIGDKRISSIYIGGGTPSYFNESYIKEIMQFIKKNFNVLEDAEITIEVNPGTVDIKSFVTYFESGINRISIGLQSADDRQLKVLGRIHSYDDYVEAVSLARNAGFINISTDLIMGIPGQDWQSLKSTLDKVLELDPVHISCYSLIIEEGTVFHKLYNEGKLDLPDEDEERLMYHNLVRYLEDSGLNHYEISNFSKKGFESKHNIGYWKCCEYIGIGAGAHSYFNGLRYGNNSSLHEYINIINNGHTCESLWEESYKISKEDSMKEYVMLGLRMTDGVSKKEFYEKYKVDIKDVFQEEIIKLMELGILELVGDNYKLTRFGLDFANIAFMEFI